MADHTFPINDAINSLGKDDAERAARLGVTTRTLYRWKAGDIPRQWQPLLDNPEFMHNLADRIAATPRPQRRRHARRQKPCACGTPPGPWAPSGREEVID